MTRLYIVCRRLSLLLKRVRRISPVEVQCPTDASRKFSLGIIIKFSGCKPPASLLFPLEIDQLKIDSHAEFQPRRCLLYEAIFREIIATRGVLFGVVLLEVDSEKKWRK